MKKIKKHLLMLFLFLLSCSSTALSVSAAKDESPAIVTGVKAKADESSVTVSWKKAENATGYQLYMKTGTSGSYKRVVTLKTTSYTVKKLKPQTQYSFRVRAYRTLNGQKYYSSSYSKAVTATPTILAPANVSDFKCYQSGNRKAYFSWDKSANATGYTIYRYDSSQKKYVKLKSTTSTSCVVSRLKNGTTYKFRIRSYRTVRGVTRYSSKYSSTVTVTPQKISAEVAAIHPLQFKATVTANITAKPANSKSKKQLVKKGTQVTVISLATICKVELANGQQVYIARAKLTLDSSIYSKKAYSRSLKEAFVNQNGYSSPTKYLIWVSTYTQQYTLYTGSAGKWKILRTAKVSTGKAATPTSIRICRITKKEEKWTYDDGRYQAPIVYFYSGNAFHSRLHNSDGSIADATIGRPASGGCVRMYDEDVTYIYKNCPIGTTVIIY